MINNIIILLSLVSVVSLIINVILFIYARRILVPVYNASEEASEIFTRLDAYQEHLQTVYELPTFYGDETLKGLLAHTREIAEYLKQYEEVYSFTQPDLLEQLEAASQELREKYEEETEEKE